MSRLRIGTTVLLVSFAVSPVLLWADEIVPPPPVRTTGSSAPADPLTGLPVEQLRDVLATGNTAAPAHLTVFSPTTTAHGATNTDLLPPSPYGDYPHIDYMGGGIYAPAAKDHLANGYVAGPSAATLNTLTLSGANTYTGATIISSANTFNSANTFSGVLTVGGSFPSAEAVSVGGTSGPSSSRRPIFKGPIPAAPHELAMQRLPAYCIEPPDIVQIEVLKLVPLPPFRAQAFDVLKFQAENPLPERPLDGYYMIEADGKVNLGPVYGEVNILGKTKEDIRLAVEQHLSQVLRQPGVSVELARASGVQPVSGQYLVGPDGTVNLRQYGVVSLSGKTVAEANAAVQERLKKFLVDPKVAVDVIAFNSQGLRNQLLSVLLRLGDVVPFRQKFVKKYFHRSFKLVGDLAAGFISAADDVDRGLQAGRSRGFAYQADHSVESVEQHSLASATDMGKEAAFDWVVLRAVAWVVSHADFNPQIVGEDLQVLFEKILCRRIASAAVAQ